jgi:ubiquinone/menaquinone biosynthesis C-methylase UbiE
VTDKEKADDVVQAWRGSASYWDRHRDLMRAWLAPVTGGMTAASAVREGDSVLDVAGGAGEPSLTFARLVGPAGRVTCTDVAPEMAAAASGAARGEGLSNLDFAVCGAGDLPFRDRTFDATVSRFGVMFFPDPPAALAGMVRATRPGGTVTLAVWGEAEANPYFSITSGILSRYVESPPEPPDAPGAFRFAERGRLAALLAQAGAFRVEEWALEFYMGAPVEFEEFWAVRVEVSDSLRKKVGSLPGDVARRLREDVREATREFFAGGAMSFPAQVLIVSGTA